jgi:hypothetical protein
MAGIVADKQRQSALQSMNKPTREVALKLAEKFDKCASAIILSQYQAGTYIATVIEEESTYGANAVKQLAAYLNPPGGETYLYNLKNFATKFEESYVRDMSSKSLPNGGHLSLQHWLALTKLSEQEDREKMMRRVFKESLSAAEVDNEIKAGAGGKRNARQGGRKPGVPTSPLAGLQKCFAISQQLNRFETVMEEAVFDAIDEADAEKVTKGLLDKLTQTKKTLQETGKKTDKMLDRIDENIERVKTVLDQKYDKAEKGRAEMEGDEDEEKPRKKDRAASNGHTGGKKKKKKRQAVSAD